MQIFVKTVRLWSLRDRLGRAWTPGRFSLGSLWSTGPGSPCGIRARMRDLQRRLGESAGERLVMPVAYMLGVPVVPLCAASSSCCVLQLQRGCHARQH